MGRRFWMSAILVCAALGASRLAMSEPYLALKQGLKCVACHVNPTGGGLRNPYGAVFAQQVLPAKPASKPLLSGALSDLVRIGADVRTSWSDTEVPHREATTSFELDQARVYGEVTLIPDKLALVVDQQVAPDSALTKEAYVRYGDTVNGWYAKGGKFYLPFGWRVQANSSFVRIASGISMSTPDTGFELGFEKPQWSAQLAVSNGAINEGEGSGHRVTAQAVWVHANMRFGAAASTLDSEVGDRDMGGLFAGLRTGPLVWLAEADLLRDKDVPEGTRSGLAALAEVNWGIRAGHNLKLTADYYDPDRDVSDDEQNRWSLVYELTPIPFLQVRAGYRRYDGISDVDIQNRRQTFVELHGFF